MTSPSPPMGATAARIVQRIQMLQRRRALRVKNKQSTEAIDRELVAAQCQRMRSEMAAERKARKALA